MTDGQMGSMDLFCWGKEQTWLIYKHPSVEVKDPLRQAHLPFPAATFPDIHPQQTEQAAEKGPKHCPCWENAALVSAR